MKTPEIQVHEPLQLKQSLNAITSRSLTPENIDAYADNALRDLIDLSEAAVRMYSNCLTINTETNKSTEDAAFQYFDLSSLEATLDHVAAIASDIDRIDDVIASTEYVGQVILPHEKGGQWSKSLESNERREAALIPRLKTLLFILEQDFDIDIHDRNQASVTAGKVDSSLMRDETYYSVLIPGLQRLVLVNDEEQNATFVFDTKILNELGLNQIDIQQATKKALNEMIAIQCGLGQRIVYSKTFVPRLKDALLAISESANTDDELRIEQVTYLVPKASTAESIKSAKTAAKELGVSREKFVDVADLLSKDIGETPDYLFGSVTTSGYDERQVGLVKTYIESQKRPLATEKIASRGGLANRLGISSYLVDSAIKELQEEGVLGEVDEYRFGNKIAPGYDTEQQEAIIALLDTRGKLNNEQPPEGDKSFKVFAEELHISRETLKTTVDAIEDIDEIKTYQFGSMIAQSLSVVQQQEVIKHLAEHTRIADGTVKSESGLANLFNVSEKTIRRAALNLADQLGEVDSYRFGARTVPGYLLNQQTMIKDWLEANHQLNVPFAPEGVVSIPGVAKLVGIDYEKAVEIISILEDKLGNINYFRFGTRKAPGLLPDQQQIIIEYVKQTSSQPAPEGVLSEYGIVRRYKLSRHVINVAINHLADTLGETPTYKFDTGSVSRGFDENQQVSIVGLAKQIKEARS